MPSFPTLKKKDDNENDLISRTLYLNSHFPIGKEFCYRTTLLMLMMGYGHIYISNVGAFLVAKQRGVSLHTS
jgi:hypothetical protein